MRLNKNAYFCRTVWIKEAKQQCSAHLVAAVAKLYESIFLNERNYQLLMPRTASALRKPRKMRQGAAHFLQTEKKICDSSPSLKKPARKKSRWGKSPGGTGASSQKELALSFPPLNSVTDELQLLYGGCRWERKDESVCTGNRHGQT